MAQNRDGKYTLPSSDPSLTDCTVPDTTGIPYSSSNSETESDSTLSHTGYESASTRSASSSPDEKITKKRKHEQDVAGQHSKPKLFHVYKSSSSESQSSSVDSALSSGDFPGNTCDWDSTVLDRLRICCKIVREEHVGEENFFQSIVAQHFFDEKDQNEYETYKRKIKTHLDQNIKVNAFIQHDFTHLILKLLDPVDVEGVPVDEVELNVNIRKAEDYIAEAYEQLKKYHQMEFWDFFFRVFVSCKNFLDTLKEMADERKSRSLSERVYEFLFIEFLKAFSLNVSQAFIRAANLTLQIAGAVLPVTSIPDVLVGFRDRDNLSSRKVVAVCEVKKNYCKYEENFERETRSKTKAQETDPQKKGQIQRDVTESFVNSQLLGQHGGELLVHLPNSVFKEKGILGMIVQATEVSLTALVPDKDYMKHLKEGFEKGSKKADFFISKPYNFLTKEGREKLYEPLLELFFLQMFFQEKDKKSSNPT